MLSKWTSWMMCFFLFFQKLRGQNNPWCPTSFFYFGVGRKIPKKSFITSKKRTRHPHHPQVPHPPQKKPQRHRVKTWEFFRRFFVFPGSSGRLEWPLHGVHCSGDMVETRCSCLDVPGSQGLWMDQWWSHQWVFSPTCKRGINWGYNKVIILNFD